MSRQTQMIVLGVLVAVLLGAVYYYYDSGSSTVAPAAVATDQRFTPLDVDNPALRTDILKRFLTLEYNGVHRSIFSAPGPRGSGKSWNPVFGRNR